MDTEILFHSYYKRVYFERYLRLFHDLINKEGQRTESNNQDTAQSDNERSQVGNISENLNIEFDLVSFADSHSTSLLTTDDIGKFNSSDIGALGLKVRKFSKHPFSSRLFWEKHSVTFPAKYRISRRIFATSISYCSSERFFHAVNRVVTRGREGISP